MFCLRMCYVRCTSFRAGVFERFNTRPPLAAIVGDAQTCGNGVPASYRGKENVERILHQHTANTARRTTRRKELFKWDLVLYKIINV